MKAYQYIVKVTKFELPTAYRFITAEGRTSLWTDSAPPPPHLACLGLRCNSQLTHVDLFICRCLLVNILTPINEETGRSLKHIFCAYSQCCLIEIISIALTQYWYFDTFFGEILFRDCLYLIYYVFSLKIPDNHLINFTIESIKSITFHCLHTISILTILVITFTTLSP